MAWGVPIPVAVLSAGLVGLLLGALGAVIRSAFDEQPDSHTLTGVAR
jgi:hypothetical protein